MKINAVHQFAPTLLRRDAVGETILGMQKLLVDAGYESKIFVEGHTNETSKLVSNFTEYKPNEKDVIIYHHAIGSNVCDFVCGLKNKKILCYHNITPSHFFEKYDKQTVSLCERGILQVEKMANYFEYVMVPSSYSKNQLKQLGFKKILQFQYFMNLERFDQIKHDKQILNNFEDKKNIIFVGRKAPNKKIDDILKIFAYYKIINQKSRLFLLGGSWTTESYQKKLDNLITKLKLEDVIFQSSLSDKELASYYKIADAFLCMSEHEGFCIPIAEAMFFGVPVIAFNSTAVPETLGGSSVIVNHKNYPEIAEILDLIISDENLTKFISEKEKIFCQKYSNENAEKLFLDNLKKITEE
jgi:glycosyltransferase involved in cell wall biosynthesis